LNFSGGLCFIRGAEQKVNYFFLPGHGYKWQESARFRRASYTRHGTEDQLYTNGLQDWPAFKQNRLRLLLTAFIPVLFEAAQQTKRFDRGLMVRRDCRPAMTSRFHLQADTAFGKASIG
jgi:hypothetical protein